MNTQKLNRHGFALILMLLIVVVLGGIYWMKGNFSISSGRQNDVSGQPLPWSEDALIVKKDKLVDTPYPAQPAISKTSAYSADVSESNEPRGTISMWVEPNGRIKGNWTGDYHQGKDFYSVLSAGFEGNTARSKVYQDKSAKDPSRLYFIAKGACIMLSDNRATNESRQRRGIIYVTGWIAKDMSIIGKVTFTSDRQQYDQFTWSSSQPLANAFGI